MKIFVKETLYRPKNAGWAKAGGLARHTVECQSGVDWGNAEIVARERGLKQRKVFEEIESLRQKHRGMRVLNNFDHVETWKPVLNSFFDREKDCSRQSIIAKVKVLHRPQTAFPAHFDIIYRRVMFTIHHVRLPS